MGGTVEEVLLFRLLAGIASCASILVGWLVVSRGRPPKRLPAHDFRKDFVVLSASGIVTTVALNLLPYGVGVAETLITLLGPIALLAATLASINTLRRRRYRRSDFSGQRSDC